MRLFPLALAALALAACDRAPEQIRVTDAVVQLPALAGRPGAAYFTIHGGSEDARLVSVSLDKAERAEFHETVMDGDIMRMRPLHDNRVPAGGELTFESGGRHVMLFGVDPALKAGDTARLTLDVEPGEPITVEAAVRAIGSQSHASH